MLKEKEKNTLCLSILIPGFLCFIPISFLLLGFYNYYIIFSMIFLAGMILGAFLFFIIYYLQRIQKL